MTKFKKRKFPVSEVRHFLEPGPIVLVSSKWKEETNIMTMGWHTVMEFSPSLVGCVIAESNHSYHLIRKSGECVINLPTTQITNKVVKIGSVSGADVNKFEQFNLTPEKAKKVKAPMITECYANFECKLYDSALIKKYNFFIFEVIYAQAAISPKHPETIHYKGKGVFMVSGSIIHRRVLPGM